MNNQFTDKKYSYQYHFCQNSIDIHNHINYNHHEDQSNTRR